MTKARPHTQRSHPRVSGHKSSAAGQPAAQVSAIPDEGSEYDRTADETAPAVARTNTVPGRSRSNQDSLQVDEVADQWLHIRWSISPKTLERALSAMGRDAHRAVRQLRLYRVQQDDSGPRSKELVQEIEIPTDVQEWFLRVPTAESAWVIEMGTAFAAGRFFSMLHSVPTVTTGTRSHLTASRKYLGAESLVSSLEGGTPPPLKVQGVFVLSGTTRPGSRTTIDDQSIEVDAVSGEFEWRMSLANGRVVVPMSVVDSGKIQRALLALDLNFHLLEPEPHSDH